MTSGAAQPVFFVAGGTLAREVASYLPRQADAELAEALVAGEFCFVLNARQMGKSSLSVRAMARLAEQGVRAVFLDLQRFGGASVTPEQWYVSLLAEIGRSLGIRTELLAYWNERSATTFVARFLGALRDVVLEKVAEPVVVLLDEVDSLRSLPFSADELFGGIRECYNERALDPAYNRLTFCIVGSALPSDLVRDRQTSPFNIGRRIDLRDFSEDEALPLAEGLARPGAHAIVRRIHHWTGGHPYLTQSLCAEVAADESVKTPSDVDAVAGRLFFEAKARERNVNLADVANRMLGSAAEGQTTEEHRAGILDLYLRVLRGRKVIDDEADRLVAVLKLSGITRTVDGCLRVRNRIYERVFDRKWVAEQMPDAEARRQRAAYRRGMMRAATVAAVVILGFATLARAAWLNAREARLTSERANHLLYIANMGLAQREWEANNAGRVREMLQETRSSQARGFEWYYWLRMCHLDILTLMGHGSCIKSAAFSPDGTRVVTGSWDNTAKVWDAQTGRETLTLRGHAEAIWSAGFSPDGRHIVTGSSDNTVKAWDAQTGRETLTLRGHTQPIVSVAFSPDGRRIVTGSADNTAKVWDAQTGRETATLRGHAAAVMSAAFSPDGRRIVTESWDYTAKVWDAQTGRETVTLRGHTQPVRSAAFSPDGRRIVTGSNDNTAKVWDAQTGRETLTLRGHTRAVRSAAFSPDGRRIITGSEDMTAKVWSAASEAQVAQWERQESARRNATARR